MTPELSIVIVNYNVRELLLKCIESIYTFTKLPFEIIVVDNNSADDSIESVRRNFPDVKTIANKYNAGFPKANNQGFAICKGQYVFMLNPDTELNSYAIDDLVYYLKTNNNVSLIAPQLLNSDGSIQYSIQRFITVTEVILEVFFLHNLYKYYHSYIRKNISAPMEVEALSGAAILFPTTLLKEIGGLDEDLFWTEDMEFCHRAFKRGKKIIYYPQVKIIHHIGQSGRKNLNVMISRQVLTKITFFKKNHGHFAYLTVKYSRLIHILSRIVIFTILSPTGINNSRAKAKAYLFTFNEFVNKRY